MNLQILSVYGKEYLPVTTVHHSTHLPPFSGTYYVIIKFHYLQSKPIVRGYHTTALREISLYGLSLQSTSTTNYEWNRNQSVYTTQPELPQRALQWSIWKVFCKLIQTLCNWRHYLMELNMKRIVDRKPDTTPPFWVANMTVVFGA